MFGNRPGYSTASVWWNLMLQIEECLYLDVPPCGVVTDVRKAFNNLPRGVVYAIARVLRMPPKLISSWHYAVENIQR